MDILGADGGHKNAASNNELAKAMFEGTHAYRRKLKLPEMNEYAEKVKAAVRRRALSRRASAHRGLFFFSPLPCRDVPLTLLVCARAVRGLCVCAGGGQDVRGVLRRGPGRPLLLP